MVLRCLGRFLLRLAPACVVALNVTADNIYWQPRMQVGVGHDSNPQMAYDTSGQKTEPSWLSQSQVDSELGIESGADKSTLFGRYWYQSVAANHDYDADVAELRGDFTHSTERSSLTANIDALFDTTLTSEFAGSGSGRSLKEKKDHRNFDGKLGYQWRLSELEQIGVDASTSRSRYVDAQSVGLNDYDTTQYDATYSRTLSERSSGGLQLAYSGFDIPELQIVSYRGWVGWQSYQTDNYIAALFGDYALSERDSISWQLGFRTSNFYQEVGPSIFKQEGNGRVFNVKYQHSSEKTQFHLTAARDVRPTSGGRIVEHDSIDATMSHTLDERMAVSISLSVDREREPVQQLTGTDRDYAQAFVSLHYNVSEQHALALELLEKWQRYRGIDDIKAESTGVFLRWYWTPTQIQWH
jgi:hypothetical protein